MIAHVSITVVLFFSIMIALSLIVLLYVTPGAVKEYKAHRASKQRSGSNKETLSSYMEEIAVCKKPERIEELMALIRRSADVMQTDRGTQTKYAKNILKWLDSFNIDIHIKDLEQTKRSNQIFFDKKRQDFQLIIIK